MNELPNGGCRVICNGNTFVCEERWEKKWFFDNQSFWTKRIF